MSSPDSQPEFNQFGIGLGAEPGFESLQNLAQNGQPQPGIKKKPQGQNGASQFLLGAQSDIRGIF